jgi:DNA repair protein RadA/Sms
MAKAKILYTCNECGSQSPKWSGQCGDCGAWNSLVETAAVAPVAGKAARFVSYAGEQAGRVQDLSQVQPGAEQRTPMGFGELDRVLGGGLVAGSVILIGGDPGIGKSTLLLQALAAFAQQLSTL